HGFAVGRVRRVAVDADLIAELAARELIGRHTIRLARQIHQRHLDGAYAARLSRMMAELFELANDFIHIAMDLANQMTLEHQRIIFACAIAYLAQAVDTLISVNADERKAPAIPADGGGADVRDAQLAWARVGSDVIFGVHGIFLAFHP